MTDTLAGDGFTAYLESMSFESGKTVQEKYVVIPDEHIPLEDYIDYGGFKIHPAIAERVQVELVRELATKKLYMVGERPASSPQQPYNGPFGYTFPFDDRCFIDQKGNVHPAAGCVTMVGEMIRSNTPRSASRMWARK